MPEQKLIRMLQAGLLPAADSHSKFALLVENDLRTNLIPILRQALPLLIDCDMSQNGDFVNQLVLHLSLYSIRSGRNLLAEFAQSVPDFSGFYLRLHVKQFEELFAFIHTNQQTSYDEDSKSVRIVMTPHYLACMHFPPKKVIVSNAPPVKLTRRRLSTKDKFQCGVSAGGLVSSIKPSLKRDDIWVSYLDTSLLDLDKLPRQMVPRLIKQSINAPAEMRRSTSVVRSSSDDDELDKSEMREFFHEKAENDFLSLQKQLDRFAESHFILKPLIILPDEYKAFYNGISNGLLWPSLHNLNQYIVGEYQGEKGRKKLNEDWERYIKVNHHFAIHAARNSRQKDMLWIQDYHLFLVGQVLRALDPTLDCAFFLHTPFRMSETFLKDFPEQGLAVLRGLLGYSRVGFQCNRDLFNFTRLIRTHFPQAKVVSTNDGPDKAFTITYQNAVTDAGTFPISIKTNYFLELAAKESTAANALDVRRRVMQKRTGKLFLSVERFDYTKGIVERLRAIDVYCRKNPERAKQDVFYQIAASSRADVSSYKQYQKQAITLALELNKRYAQSEADKLVILDQNNHPLEEVVWLYRAADVVIVTPLADGMNLVIKEAVLCNPKLTLILSTGAGAENQFADNGLSDCYLRVDDPRDPETFANQIRQAADVTPTQAKTRGQRLQLFVKRFDIDFWLESFTDAGWTHRVVRRRTLRNTRDLQLLMTELNVMRRQAVSTHLNGGHLGTTYALSVRNAMANFNNTDFEDIQRILVELRLDEAFLDCLINRRALEKLIFTLSQSVSSLIRRQFFQQYRALVNFNDDFGPADLMILPNDVIVQASCYEFANMQTIASGVLWARFFNRFAQHALILSDLPLDQMQYQLLTPLECISAVVGWKYGELIIADRERTSFGTQTQGDEIRMLTGALDKTIQTLKFKLPATGGKILIFASDHHHLDIIEWALQRYPTAEIGLICLGSVECGTKGIEIHHCNCLPVLMAAIASCILKVVKSTI